ncbi:hypothetical protein H0O03_01985 [Candidatus Micrarchaeota archaeon]|nr:hypothetical protein [Candidatus Micrarchaeota archaeon]
MKTDRQELQELEEQAVVNSEVRFIALELMKISALTGKSFHDVANEFCENALQLKKAFNEAAAPVRRQKPKRRH